MDDDDIGIPDFTVDIVLDQHIPDTLPIKGKRIRLSYPGIPTLCSRCWKIGHTHYECKQKHKTNWLELVCDFYIDDNVTESMLGSWVEALYKYHPSLTSDPEKKYPSKLFVSQEKTRDLRYKIPNEPAKKDDLRELLKKGKTTPQQQEDLREQLKKSREKQPSASQSRPSPRRSPTRRQSPERRQSPNRNKHNKKNKRNSPRRDRDRRRSSPPRGQRRDNRKQGFFRNDPRHE